MINLAIASDAFFGGDQIERQMFVLIRVRTGLILYHPFSPLAIHTFARSNGFECRFVSKMVLARLDGECKPGIDVFLRLFGLFDNGCCRGHLCLFKKVKEPFVFLKRLARLGSRAWVGLDRASLIFDHLHSPDSLIIVPSAHSPDSTDSFSLNLESPRLS